MTSCIRAALVGLAIVCAAAAQAASLAGHYEGTIQAPDREVKFTVDLTQGDKGWTGYLSMMPGPREIPLEKLDVKGDAVTFTLGVQNGPSFEGKWDKDAATIKGTVTGPNGDVPFEVTRTGDAKAVVVTPSSPLSPEFAGTWEGKLEISGKALRLQLNLKQGASGKAEGTLVSLDQGGQAIPISTITQSGNKLEFEIRMISGSFKGAMNEAKDAIAGDWTQGPRTLPLTFTKAAAAK